MERKNMNLTNEMKKRIGILAAAFVVAFFLIFGISNRFNKGLALSLSEGIEAENGGIVISEDGTSVSTTDKDPHWTFGIENRFVREIVITLREPVNEAWDLKVYYSYNTEPFSEEKTAMLHLDGTETTIRIPIKSYAEKFRLDLGTEANRTYGVEKISVNPVSRTEYAFAILICFAVLAFLMEYIGKMIREKAGVNGCDVAYLFCASVIFLLTLYWSANLKNSVHVFDKLFAASDGVGGISLTFTTLNFIFIFLPVCLAGYYLLPKKQKNLFLLVISLVFYTVGEPVMIGLLLLSIFVNYVFGLLLSYEWKKSFVKLICLVAMLLWNFGLLFYYKYYIFTLDNISLITGSSIRYPNIIQPLGISFFTFRTISFCLDVYWKTVPMQTNLLDVALYICFFPQISMGPISKYNDFFAQLKDRPFDSELFLDGIKRMILGWAKKLIIADNMAVVVDAIFAMEKDERTVLLAWIGIIGYLIQLYYDFSGYSDIAIGVGQMFGFKTPENFNYPFLSKSVVEYWSRWHITLGTWLKNYMYTPLFRACQEKNISIGTCNVLALLGVWIFAGVWHGVGWNYLCYGLYYFAFIVLERVVEDKKKKKRKCLKLKKQPETTAQKVRAHIYFFIVLIFGQLLFRCKDLPAFGAYFASMFGFGGNKAFDAQTYYYFLQSITLLIVGWIFAFPVVGAVKEKVKGSVGEKVITVITPVVYGVLLIVSLAYAMTSTYQSFIYFKF